MDSMRAHGILQLAPQHDVIGHNFCTYLQHAPDLAIERHAIGDVHRHMLQQHAFERPSSNGSSSALPPGTTPSRLPGALRQIAHGIDKGLAEVDAGDAATVLPRPRPRRWPNTESPHPAPTAVMAIAIAVGGEATGVKLVRDPRLSQTYSRKSSGPNIRHAVLSRSVRPGSR